MTRAKREGWSGPVFACSSCKGINPCGMLICLHCHCPFVFQVDMYPDYLVSPMAKRIVSQVVEKTLPPELTVPDPVRRDIVEVARAHRYGAFTGKFQMRNCSKK